MSNNFTKLSTLCLVGLTTIANAQTEYNGRVGINTITPNATLQI